MFCMKCGSELPEGAQFCMKCGTPLGNVESTDMGMNKIQSSTKLVSAKCTNCGAALQVDSTLKTATCPYCNSSYVVEQAINNFNISMSGNLNVGSATINVSGANLENLLERALIFEDHGEYEEALEYYNKVLDIDVKCVAANEGRQRVKGIIENYVYKECICNKGFTTGKLQLQKNYLHFVNAKGKKTSYALSDISNPIVSIGTFTFMLSNGLSISFGGLNAKEWVDLVINAKMGMYPEMKKVQQLSEVDNVILKNFNRKNKVAAIKFYREKTGADLQTAKEHIDMLFW